MKTLGNKSLSNFLLAIIQIVWWLEWIGAIVITGALIIMPFFKKGINFNTPVTFSATPINVIANSGTIQPGQLNATEGNFSFEVPAGVTNSLIPAFIAAGAFFFFIAATYQLRLIFLSFTKNEPFAEFNIARVRKIGLILIGYTLAHLIYHIALNEYLTSQFRWANDIRLTYSFNISALLIGLTLIVIAEVFKLGTTLENEQKLTI